MGTKKLILSVLSLLLFCSCEDNNLHLDSNNLLIGNWANPIYNSEVTTFSRTKSLPDEAYGMSFSSNGNFIERTSGFCGTPPLTFFNEEGSFILKDSLITISNNSFLSKYNLRIVTLTAEELVVKRELTTQEIEHRALMDAYNNIYEIGYSAPCSNLDDWAYTAFGAKACGGPQGYIPYSKKIDTIALLKKIDNYTKAEKNFNIKWGIISTCDLPAEPKSVECINGHPTLKYE